MTNGIPPRGMDLLNRQRALEKKAGVEVAERKSIA